MAKDQKQKRERLTSPVGIAVYPRVDGKPDTKFNKDGVWSTQLAFEGKTADKFKALIDGWMEKAMEWAQEQEKFEGKTFEMADPPYQPEIDKEAEEETGRTLVRFKLNAKASRKDGTEYNQHVSVIKADLTPFPDSRVGGGTKARVGFEVAPFAMPGTQGPEKKKVYCGVSLRLRVFQIIDYVAWEGGANPASFKMDAVEGYVGAETPATASDDDDDETEEDDDEPVKPTKATKAFTPKDKAAAKKALLKATTEDEEEEEEETPKKPVKKGKKVVAESEDDDF